MLPFWTTYGSSYRLSRLSDISATDTLELFHRIPSHRISETAIEFAQKILEINQNRLLNFTL
jgi:hypothetical protein